MPLANQRKAIRFTTVRSMLEAIHLDRPYQYRHLVLKTLNSTLCPMSRKQISDETGIPINTMSNAIQRLLKDGAIEECHKIPCPVTGREVVGVKINRDYAGLY